MMGAKKSKKALNSEELLYVMKQTNLDATTINDWYGGFISDCPTGKMTPSHFSHMYKMLFQVEIQKSFVSMCLEHLTPIIMVILTSWSFYWL